LITYKGIKWYYYQGVLLPSAPPHHEINLSKEEQKELLKLSNALLLRYTSEWKREESIFWFVIKEDFKGMDELSVNTRSKIRRGGKRNIVRKVPSEEIARLGYCVYRSAFEQYRTFIDPLSEEAFRKHIKSQGECEYWAVFDKESGQMVAYSENFINGNMCLYSTIKFHPEYLKNYTSYILFYEMNKYYLETKKMAYVNDGARSISHETAIQKYLIEKFRFTKAYVKLHIVYRWDVGLAVAMLYPFRDLIGKVDHPLLNKVSVILKQEEIRRYFE